MKTVEVKGTRFAVFLVHCAENTQCEFHATTPTATSDSIDSATISLVNGRKIVNKRNFVMVLNLMISLRGWPTVLQMKGEKGGGKVKYGLKGLKIYSVCAATPGAWVKGLLMNHLLAPAAEGQVGVVRATGEVFAENIAKGKKGSERRRCLE